MLNFFYEFIPVLLFFLAFKFYDIYTATIVGIAATGVQVVITRLVQGYFDKKQLTTFAVFVVFGSMTLYFHNPIFVKWKPTVVFWFFAVALLVSHFAMQKPLLQRLFDGMAKENQTIIPQQVWHRLTFAWVVFFFILGAVNIYIAYSYSTAAWVNFKFYGILGMLLFFSFAQAIYLTRYFPSQKQ